MGGLLFAPFYGACGFHVGRGREPVRKVPPFAGILGLAWVVKESPMSTFRSPVLVFGMLALTALCLCGTPALVSAAPVDAKVGSARAAFNRRGTPLRAKPSTLGAAVATLTYGTRMQVLEVKLPWLRVRTAASTGQPAATGWLRAWETVEPSALATNAKPAHLTSSGSAGATSREVSAAGRQLDEGTERRYRASHADLARGYRAVDAMEAASAALDPGEALAFIDAGSLGRRGRDYARPGRVKPAPVKPKRRRRSSGGGGLLGRLGGEAARRLGAGKVGSRVAGSLLESAADYVDQVKVKFTPQQEYYLGRAVAAQAIARYGIDGNAARRHYVRLVGEALVRLTPRVPANFGGYHFDVLATDEVNGISGPGGFVLLTRGAVEACASEAELAGILAHELAHITQKHGERLLRQGREFPSFVKGLASAGGAAAGGGGAFAQGLATFFGKVAGQVSTTAMSHGYGKALEFAADKEGTYLAFDVWYDHVGLRTFLDRLGQDPTRHATGATHASPTARARALDPIIAALQPFKARPPVLATRLDRFRAALGRGTPQPR